MNDHALLNNYLQSIIGTRWETLNFACEMMMFGFETYALHAQCFARIICGEEILVTTSDYQSWDGESEGNNDEWYFAEKYKSRITGGIVTAVNVTAFHDVEIVMENGVKIELFIQNGHHHFGGEQEQWVFFKPGDHAYPFITVYNKTVDLAENW